jgi:proline dehydrogenase
MSFFDRLIRWALPLTPKLVVRRVARRYIAGVRLEDALRTVRDLRGQGAMATLDVLGEEARERPQAEAAVREYLQALEAIRAEGLDCNISVKLTHLGLRLDETYCLSCVDRVAIAAARLGNFVRLDMEDHTVTDATLRIYGEAQRRHGNVGVVLQSMLRRTLGDVGTLLRLRPNVRLCKGIYREPRAIAWRDPETIRANYVCALEKLLAQGCYVGIATHDEHLVWAGMTLVEKLGLAPDRYEFQMLLGVDAELRRIILDRGHRVRVYVPYGEDWYGYSVRRLRENPTVARHVLRALFSTGPSGSSRHRP